MPQVVGTQFGPSALVFGLTLNSPYTTLISDAIKVLQLNGALDLIIRKHAAALNECPPTSNSFYKLSVKQFLGLWYVQVGMAVLATIIVILENLRYHGAPVECEQHSVSEGLEQAPIADEGLKI